MSDNQLNPSDLLLVAHYRLLRALLLQATNSQLQILRQADISPEPFVENLNDDLVQQATYATQIPLALTMLQAHLTPTQLDSLEQWAYHIAEDQELLEVGEDDYLDALFDLLVPEILAYIDN